MAYRLAYLGEAYVNWCPALGTVLANDEVKDGLSERGGHPVERKLMKQWSMRITAYAERLLQGLENIDWSDSLKEAQRNWIGKSVGTTIKFALQDSDEFIEVFTTRPDTLFGVSFVTLAPEHELVDKITSPTHRAEVQDYVTKTKTATNANVSLMLHESVVNLLVAMPFILLQEIKFQFGLATMYLPATALAQ